MQRRNSMLEASKHEKLPEALNASNFASRPETGTGGFENEEGGPPDDLALSENGMPGNFREARGNPEPPDNSDLSELKMPSRFQDEVGSPAGAESSANEPKEQP